MNNLVFYPNPDVIKGSRSARVVTIFDENGPKKDSYTFSMGAISCLLQRDMDHIIWLKRAQREKINGMISLCNKQLIAPIEI